MNKIGLFLIMVLPLSTMASPTVSNIRASQRENSKQVDILYNVAYSGASNVSITCEISTNSGASYNVPSESFSGDGYGVMVSTGIDRLITWNAGIDWDENYSEQVRVRITAKAPRFTDNGDGSVTDNQTGLMWQKNAVAYDDPDVYGDSSLMIQWFYANDACATLGEGWRLPTVAEIGGLLDANRSPPLPAGHPFECPLEIYWTANIRYIEYVGRPYDRPFTECFSLITGEIFTAPVVFSEYWEPHFHYVWPVRSVY